MRNRAFLITQMIVEHWEKAKVIMGKFGLTADPGASLPPLASWVLWNPRILVQAECVRQRSAHRWPLF